MDLLIERARGPRREASALAPVDLPARVRESALFLMDRAKEVAIDDDEILKLARRLFERAKSTGDGDGSPTTHEWDPEGWHYEGQPSKVAQYLFVLDALNFCFWPANEELVAAEEGRREAALPDAGKAEATAEAVASLKLQLKEVTDAKTTAILEEEFIAAKSLKGQEAEIRRQIARVEAGGAGLVPIRVSRELLWVCNLPN